MYIIGGKFGEELKLASFKLLAKSPNLSPCQIFLLYGTYIISVHRWDNGGVISTEISDDLHEMKWHTRQYTLPVICANLVTMATIEECCGVYGLHQLI